MILLRTGLPPHHRRTSRPTTNAERASRGRRWLVPAALVALLAGTAFAQAPPLSSANLARLARAGGPLPEGHAVAVNYAGTLDYEGHYERPGESRPFHSLRRIVVAAPLLAREDWTTWSDEDTARSTQTTLLLGDRVLRRDRAGAGFHELHGREAGEAVFAIVAAAPPLASARIRTWNGRGLSGGPLSAYMSQYAWPDSLGAASWNLDGLDQPVAYAVLRDDPRRGSQQIDAHCFSTATVGGRSWPDSLRTMGQPADVTWNLFERRTAVEDDVPLAELAAPDSVAPGEPLADTTVRVVPLAAGVWALELPDADTRSLAVEFANHVVLLETSSDNVHGERLRAALRERFPRKPVRFVAFSHYHPDYTGGLRPFLADSATVVCPGSLRPFVDEVAHRNFAVFPDRLARQRRADFVPGVDTLVAGRWRHADAANELVVIDIGKRSHHTDQYQVFWLPRQKLLFEGDLGFFSSADGVHASRRAAGLLQAVDDARIDPRTVVQSWPVNGNAASVPFATLRALVAARDKP